MRDPILPLSIAYSRNVSIVNDEDYGWAIVVRDYARNETDVYGGFATEQEAETQRDLMFPAN